MLTVTCTNCKKVIHAFNHSAGTMIQCHGCRRPVFLPGAPTSQPSGTKSPNPPAKTPAQPVKKGVNRQHLLIGVLTVAVVVLCAALAIVLLVDRSKPATSETAGATTGEAPLNNALAPPDSPSQESDDPRSKVDEVEKQPPPKPRKTHRVPVERPSKFVDAPELIDRVIGHGSGGKVVTRTLSGNLHVFDPERSEFTKPIPLHPTESLIATGGDFIVIFLSEKEEFQVLDMFTGERRARYPNPLGAPILGLVMGKGTGDRFWVCIHRNERNADKSERPDAFILNTLDGTVLASMNTDRRDPTKTWTVNSNLRATPDLSAIASSNRHSFPTGVNILSRGPSGGWDLRREHTGSGAVTPLIDGRAVDCAGAVTDDVLRIARHDEAFYSAVGSHDLMLEIERTRGAITLRNIHDGNSLFSFGVLPAWSYENPRMLAAELDLRVSYDPESGHMVAIGLDGKTVLHACRPLDEIIDASPAAMLVMRSETPAEAVRGEPWTHRLNFLSNCTVSFKLQRAPAGMEISQDGELHWTAPLRMSEPETIEVDASYKSITRRQRVTVFPSRRTEFGVTPVRRLPKLASEQLSSAHDYLPLGGLIGFAIPTGTGRHVVCAQLMPDRLAVVDLIEAREVASIPWKVTKEPSPVAAGGNRVVVYDREQNELRVHELTTGKQIAAFQNPLPYPIWSMVMGMENDEEVLCLARADRDSILDIVTLENGRRMNGETRLREDRGRGLHLIAGTDLSTVTATEGANGNSIFARDENSATYSVAHKHETAGVFFPMPNGEVLGDNGTYGLNLSLRSQFHVFQPGIGYRPVTGSEVLLQVRDGTVSLLPRDRSGRRLGKIPERNNFTHFSIPNWPYWMKCSEVERVYFSAAINRGYMLPIGYPGIVVLAPEILAADGKVAGDPDRMKVVPGTRWIHRIDKIDAVLKRSPPGMQLSADGELSWDVPATLRSTVHVEVASGERGAVVQKFILEPACCEITDPQTWRNGKGLLLINAADVKVGAYPAFAYAAIARGKDLYCIDAGTLRPRARVKLPQVAKKIAVRSDCVVVLTERNLLVYSQPKLELRSTVELPCDKPTDLAIHPTEGRSWVAGTEPGLANTFESRRIFQVDEKAESARWLQDVYGVMVAVTPDGKTLFTGVKETFSDSATVISRWGEAFLLTRRGFLDLLLRYRLINDEAHPEQMHQDVGGNLQRIVVSPTGRHVSPIAGGGFPGVRGDLGYAIPALNAENILALDAAYAVPSWPKFIAYHPTLELVVAGSEKSARLCDLRTGRAIGKDLAAANAITEIEDVFFMGDPRFVCILGNLAGRGRALVQVELELTDDERRNAGEFLATPEE